MKREYLESISEEEIEENEVLRNKLERLINVMNDYLLLEMIYNDFIQKRIIETAIFNDEKYKEEILFLIKVLNSEGMTYDSILLEFKQRNLVKHFAFFQNIILQL